MEKIRPLNDRVILKRVKEDDTTKGSGTEVKVEGEMLLMVREDDILGVVEGG
jgi:co-chaperonin GroES (HSP10)